MERIGSQMAFDIGYADGLRGYWDNPFQIGSKEAKRYNDGFDKGEAERKAKAVQGG